MVDLPEQGLPEFILDSLTLFSLTTTRFIHPPGGSYITPSLSYA